MIYYLSGHNFRRILFSSVTIFVGHNFRHFFYRNFVIYDLRIFLSDNEENRHCHEWRIGIFGTSAVGLSVNADSTRVSIPSRHEC